MGIIIFGITVVLFCLDLLPNILSKNKSLIWQPTTFMMTYLTYYVLIPFVKGNAAVSDMAQEVLLLGTLLFYIIFRLAYSKTNPRIDFPKLNNYITNQNAIKYATILFVLVFLGYGIFNGFSLSVFSNASKSDVIFDENGSYGHTEMYITYLVSVFTFCCAVVYSVKQRFSLCFITMMTITMIIYIIGGFRYRILMLFVTVFTVIYLYPKPRSIKYHIVIPIFLVMYMFMGVMEVARMYGRGLDINIIAELQETKELKEASENLMVYEFSAECMYKYGQEDLIWFEPILNAALMPIPRVLFPWKPKGLYMRDANMKIYGTITHGNAFLNITEAYVSFGWIGIIIYAWFLGWLSKLFWNNYQRNKETIGAVAMLGLYNATLYQIVARGYMAQALTTFVYYVFMPYWILMLMQKIKILK